MCEYQGCNDDINSEKLNNCCEKKFCEKHDGSLCTICEDYTICSTCEERHKCIDCKGIICNKCITFDQNYIAEWLSVGIYCIICQKLVCRKCVNFCYDCMNEFYCDDKIYCKEHCPDNIKYIDCRLHEWSTCDKHEEELHFKI